MNTTHVLLPSWMGGGVEVSALAYEVTMRGFRGQLGSTPAEQAAQLGVDEADILRVWAELKAKGVLVDDEDAA